MFTPPIMYLVVIIAVLAVAGSVYSLCLFIRDRRKNRPVASDNPHKAPAIPSYELSAWIDNEFVARKLYRRSDLSAQGLAAELGLTIHQLERAISHASIYSVDEYIRTRRVQVACRLLRNEHEMTAEEVGRETGFATFQDFRTAFARAMGMTPDTYRNMMTPRKSAK